MFGRRIYPSHLPLCQEKYLITRTGDGEYGRWLNERLCGKHFDLLPLSVMPEELSRIEELTSSLGQLLMAIGMDRKPLRIEWEDPQLRGLRFWFEGNKLATYLPDLEFFDHYQISDRDHQEYRSTFEATWGILEEVGERASSSEGRDNTPD